MAHKYIFIKVLLMFQYNANILLPNVLEISLLTVKSHRNVQGNILQINTVSATKNEFQDYMLKIIITAKQQQVSAVRYHIIMVS